MWRVFGRVSRRSHKTDDVSRLDGHSFVQPFRVPVQVRIVITILCLLIELVDGDAARFAEEQFANRSAYRRTHGRSSRFGDVHRLMSMAVMSFFKRVSQIRKGESADGRSHFENRRGPANSKNC